MAVRNLQSSVICVILSLLSIVCVGCHPSSNSNPGKSNQIYFHPDMKTQGVYDTRVVYWDESPPAPFSQFAIVEIKPGGGYNRFYLANSVHPGEEGGIGPLSITMHRYGQSIVVSWSKVQTASRFAIDSPVSDAPYLSTNDSDPEFWFGLLRVEGDEEIEKIKIYPLHEQWVQDNYSQVPGLEIDNSLEYLKLKGESSQVTKLIELALDAIDESFGGGTYYYELERVGDFDPEAAAVSKSSANGTPVTRPVEAVGEFIGDWEGVEIQKGKPAAPYYRPTIFAGRTNPGLDLTLSQDRTCSLTIFDFVDDERENEKVYFGKWSIVDGLIKIEYTTTALGALGYPRNEFLILKLVGGKLVSNIARRPEWDYIVLDRDD